MTRSARLVLVLLVVLAVQLAVLTIGITDDYRLKHEDNNALHATFARSHLHLGFETTKAQNYFYTPAAESGTFYANHPPGPGVVLAAVYRLTGHDGPTVTRATAIMFHMLSTVLFLGFACRVSRDRWDASFATLVFVLLPESAFFGRMMNHEVIVLPAGILLVWSYWESVHATERAPGWQAVSVVASVWAALAGWAGFFVIAACILHAVWEVVFRQNARGRRSLVLLVVLGSLLFLADVVHLAWVQDEPTHLRDLFASRIGLDADYGAAWRIGRILEVHWRYFSLTGMVALAVLAYRGIRDMRMGATTDPLTDVGLIFFVAGASYIVVFNLNAAQHDYWQFLLLPASAIAIATGLRCLYATVQKSRRRVYQALLILACAEVIITAAFTLSQRHMKTEAYCLETVEALRRDVL